MKIDFVRFSNSAITPTKGTEDSAGFDLCSVESITVLSIPLNVLKQILTLRSLGNILEKIYARSSLAVGVLKFVGMSLMLTIGGRLWFSFLIFPRW